MIQRTIPFKQTPRALVRCRRFSCAVAAWWALVAAALGHGQPFDVFADNSTGQLYINPNIEAAQLVNYGTGLADVAAGFGVSFPSNGVAPATEIQVETTGGLLYWNGADVVPIGAVLRFENPEYGGSGVAAYTIAADSPPQTGMIWGAYNGLSFWHLDGYYQITPGSAPAGIYGAQVRLNADAYLPSEPFIVPMVYDPNNVWDLFAELAGIDALTAAMATAGPGDFDRDGTVDGADFLVWQRNGEASQLADWSSNFGVAASANFAAVPEPRSATLLAAAITGCVALNRRRRDY